MTRLTVALRRYPHTEPLLDGTVKVACDLDFPEIEPIHRAFAPMVRELRYDVSELAIATLLQAVEAGVPVAALPVVLHGNFHHKSISVWGGEGGSGPRTCADGGWVCVPTARRRACGSVVCSVTPTVCAPRT